MDPEKPQATAYKRKLKFASDGIDRKRIKKEEIIRQLNYLDGSIEFLSIEVEKSHQTIEKITEDNTQKKITIESLTGQLDDLGQKTKIADNSIQSLNEQLTTLQELQNKTQGENTELNDQITNLHEQINNLTATRDHLQGLYNEGLTSIGELNRQIEENNTKIAALDKQIKIINTQLTDVQQERDKLAEELENISGEYETIKNRYSAVQAENKTLKDTYNTLRNDYNTIQDISDKNERLYRQYYDQYNASQSSITNLKEQNRLLDKQKSELGQSIKELKNTAKLRDDLIKTKESRITELERQIRGHEGQMEEKTSELMDLRGQLTTVRGELDNKKAEYQQKLNQTIEQNKTELAALETRLQERAQKAIDDLNAQQKRERTKLENNINLLKERLLTADAEQKLALERAERDEMIKLQKMEDKYTTAHAKLYREYTTQQENLKAALAEKQKLEKEIANNEKLLAQLEASKNELKDAKMQAQELKRKWGDSVQLQKEIASLEEQKIQLEADRKTYKKELETLKKAHQQINSRLPRGISKGIPSALEIPPLLETAPRPPPIRQSRQQQATTYNLPQLPNYNLPPPTYFPKWPENPNKLTLEIKVVGAEGGAKAGLESNLSPVSRPKGDIISKLPFGSYGIDIFQPEKFRKMDTKPDKNKEKKQLSPYQIARSIGNSLFRNLNPVRIRKTDVGVDNTYYAIEKTPEIFETFSRSARKNKVTRIY